MAHHSKLLSHGSSYVPSFNRRSHILGGNLIRKRRTVAVCATVYGPDGKIMAEEEQLLKNPLDLTTCDSVMAQLDHSTVLLSRLACAFAPPPHDHLLPDQVVSVSLERIGSNHIDLAIAVPTGKVCSGTSDFSGDQLAQILIPVMLPETVISQDQKVSVSLVVRQMQQLEVIALERLSRRENEIFIERTQYTGPGTKQIEQQLTDAPEATDWPEWWTFSQAKFTVQEEYKSLLNEVEFANSLIALCQRNYQQEPILQAKVVSIGPAGVFLRARVGKETNGAGIVDIPIPFPSGESATTEELRENVITLIESIEIQEEVFIEDTAETNVFVQLSSTTSPDGAPESIVNDALKKEIEAFPRDSAPVSGFHGRVQQRSIDVALKQPKSTGDEARLAAKFAAIEDIGERAFEILKYLGMI
jgi:hypothetical protein